MDVQERTEELLRRAEDRGFCFDYDSGFLVVKKPADVDPDVENDVVTGVGKLLSSVRRVVEKRAIAARAKELVGRQVWMMDFGLGTLSRSDSSGGLTVSVSTTPYRASSFHANAEGMFVILEEPPHGQVDSEETTAPKRKRLFGLLS